MKYNKRATKKRWTSITRKNLLYALSVVVIIVGIIFTLERTRVINIIENTPSITAIKDQDAKTTSTVPSAQENFSDGNERSESGAVNKDEGYGTVKDNLGISSESTDSSLWNSSKSGEITIHNPTKNKKLTTGTEISGTSILKMVSFRVIDNVSGVISQGEIQVVNGKFSGILTFTTTATEGRVDVYASKDDGQEYSNVEVPIKF